MKETYKYYFIDYLFQNSTCFATHLHVLVFIIASNNFVG